MKEDLEDHNKWADFWRYTIGVNVIPADTRNKITNEVWSKWQSEPIPECQHNEWKSKGSFNHGIPVILGRVLHNKERLDLYLVGIDADNKKAVEEICTYKGRKTSLEQLAKWTLVEQHKDASDKAHIYIYSRKPFAKKSSDKGTDTALNAKLDSNEIPAIEVKSEGAHGIFFCTPSIHKNGYPYQILDQTDPVLAEDFEQHIEDICRKYGIRYSSTQNNLIPIKELFKEDTKIVEGHNRHEALLRAMESLLKRTRGILSIQQVKQLCKEWNDQHCAPPLARCNKIY